MGRVVEPGTRIRGEFEVVAATLTCKVCGVIMADGAVPLLHGPNGRLVVVDLGLRDHLDCRRPAEIKVFPEDR